MQQYLFHKTGTSDVLYATVSSLKLIEKNIYELVFDYVFGILCPHRFCPCILQFEEVKIYADKSSFERFDRLVLKITLETMSDVKCCPKCSSYNVHVNTVGVIYCNSCKEGFCCFCKMSHPTSIPCEKFKEWKEMNDSATERFVHWAKTIGVQLCPKCNTMIEKNGGCTHMSCTKCKLNFDWVKDRRNFRIDETWKSPNKGSEIRPMFSNRAWRRRKGARRRGLVIPRSVVQYFSKPIHKV